MLRGDDVAELQRRLNGLGFDAGREDGILGDDTAGAIMEFQRNVGLATDGICGRGVIAALDRVGSLADGSVASVREREALRRGPHQLHGRRVFLAAAPGFETLIHAIAHELLEEGTQTFVDISGAGDSELAAAANRFAADFFLALRPGDRTGCTCSYFESGRFRSEAGYEIASALRNELAPLLGHDASSAGRAYAVLRETRMAAVICEPVAPFDLDGMRELVAHGREIARAVVRGVRRGIERQPINPSI
jgi:N-acetylmuramoyl-L-alanine amidase